MAQKQLSPRAPSWSAIWLPLLAFGATMSALFPGVLFRGETLYLRDLWSVHRCLRWVMLQATGESGWPPQWNPLLASGQPLAANPHFMVFNPSTWLFFVLPFDIAFSVQVLLPWLLAGGGVVFLLRTLGRSQLSSLLGGLGWACGGYLLSTVNLLPILLTVAPLGWLLGATIRVARSGTSGAVLGMAVSMALVVAGGEPVTCGLVLVLTAATAVYSRSAAFTTNDRPPDLPTGRSVILVLCSAALGTALAAATLLPGVHLVGRTVRGGSLPDEEVLAWSLPPLRLAELLSPSAVPYPPRDDLERRWWDSLYPETHEPLLGSLYPGLVVTLLAIAGSLTRAPHRGVGLLLVAGGAFLASGHYSPMWGLWRMTGLGMFVRYPEKCYLLTSIGLVVLATGALDLLVSGDDRTKRYVRGLAAGATLIGGVMLTTVIVELVATHSTDAIATVKDNRLLAVGGSLALQGIVMLAVFLRPGVMNPIGRIAPLVLLVLLGVELVTVGRRMVPSFDADVHDHPPPFLVPAMGKPLDSRLAHLAAWRSQLRRDGLRGGIAAAPVPARWGIATTLDSDFDRTNLAWTAIATEQHLRVMNAAPELGAALLRRAGVSSIVRLHDESGRDQSSGLFNTPVTGHLPLAWCATSVHASGEPEAWARRVMELGPDVVGAAILDDVEIAASLTDPSPCQASIVSWHPSRIVLEVVGSGPRLSALAINQTWDTWWMATVDRAPVRLLRRDLSLSAVVVSPGRHQVVLEYRDRSVVAGMWVSISACTILLGLAVIPRALRQVRRCAPGPQA